MSKATFREQCVQSYLTLIKQTVDKDAYVDEYMNIHFEEFDEKHRCKVPVTINAEQAETEMLALTYSPQEWG